MHSEQSGVPDSEGLSEDEAKLREMTPLQLAEDRNKKAWKKARRTFRRYLKVQRENVGNAEGWWDEWVDHSRASEEALFALRGWWELRIEEQEKANAAAAAAAKEDNQ